jgi:hypothetical protein
MPKPTAEPPDPAQSGSLVCAYRIDRNAVVRLPEKPLVDAGYAARSASPQRSAVVLDFVDVRRDREAVTGPGERVARLEDSIHVCLSYGLLPTRPRVDIDVELPDRVQRGLDVHLVLGDPGADVSTVVGVVIRSAPLDA